VTRARYNIPMLASFSFQRTISVARKELLHIFRDPQTLFFTLVIPHRRAVHARVCH
jgi:hypothetical protein